MVIIGPVSLKGKSYGSKNNKGDETECLYLYTGRSQYFVSKRGAYYAMYNGKQWREAGRAREKYCYRRLSPRFTYFYLIRNHRVSTSSIKYVSNNFVENYSLASLNRYKNLLCACLLIIANKCLLVMWNFR